MGYNLRVLDEVQRGGFWYLTMQVDSGPNCNVQGQCGAGSTTDLVWLRLDKRLRLVAKRSEHLASTLQLRGGVLNVRVSGDDSGNSKGFGARYNHLHPERGLMRY